jgi:magnesium-transporting ATPase (P-type)
MKQVKFHFYSVKYFFSISNISVPTDFQEILTHYTKQGFRVIAIAKKNLFINFVKAQKIERELIENELEFLGLIILENRLKIPTTPVIKTLKDANIKTIMCTGDNLLTALSVAHECKMIDKNQNVIIVEVENINEEPKFRYTNVVKEKLIQIDIDRKVYEIIII